MNQSRLRLLGHVALIIILLTSHKTEPYHSSPSTYAVQEIALVTASLMMVGTGLYIIVNPAIGILEKGVSAAAGGCLVALGGAGIIWGPRLVHVSHSPFYYFTKK
ncbi:hypothetical protein J120_01225 [candidate division TM6 bacterium JCVI TM6SC1]|uniref:Uncharacterized protein n=1 Tax=candidate division TM6 bacterium JCVI TM6SC1 TaxID=1306947 RepID=A0A0D2GQB1_9BACT|nr:hypothetical protein J120_01225 [candidate division TM6 bacterium JCVI TM6SC1]